MTSAARSRLLTLCLAAVTATAGHQVRAADDAAELAAAFNRAYRAEDWQGALEIGLEIEASTPGRPIHRYNLACVAARAGAGDQAVAWLGQAAASGFWRLPQLERDPDLDGIRTHPGFDEAAAAVAGNFQAFRAVVEQRFAATPPLLMLPPDHRVDEPAPIVVALHGHGGRASGYPTLWRRAAAKAGAVLVIPQAVRQSGPGFTWQDPDEAGIIVDLTLDWVRREVTVDDDNIVLTGFSEGGFVAMVIGTRQPNRFVGVIPMAGGYIPELDAPPRERTGRMPRYYFMVGSLDQSADAVRRAADDYRDAGYQAKLRVLPGTGHTFPRDTDRELGRALRFALGGSSTGSSRTAAGAEVTER